MHALALFVAATVASVHLIGEVACGALELDAMRLLAVRMPVYVHLVNESMLSSMLFTAARLLTHQRAATEQSVTIVADCASELIGVDFDSYRIGMDCGTTFLRSLMDKVDPLHDAEAFSVKLTHVIQHADGWYDDGTCAVWGNDALRAAFFWLALYGAVVAAKTCWCLPRNTVIREPPPVKAKKR